MLQTSWVLASASVGCLDASDLTGEGVGLAGEGLAGTGTGGVVTLGEGEAIGAGIVGVGLFGGLTIVWANPACGEDYVGYVSKVATQHGLEKTLYRHSYTHVPGATRSASANNNLVDGWLIRSALRRCYAWLTQRRLAHLARAIIPNLGSSGRVAVPYMRAKSNCHTAGLVSARVQAVFQTPCPSSMNATVLAP